METSRGWTSHAVGIGAGAVSILMRQESDRVVAVPARPLLARDAAGRPKLSLTLVLSQCPSVDATSVAPLVTQGTLAFTVTLALPDAALTLSEETARPVQPLFARSARFSLRLADTELQETRAFGPGATAAFSAMLDRAAALEAVSAIGGASSRLQLVCEIEHLVTEEARYLRLSGDYEEIYRHLVREGRRPLDRAALERMVAMMLFDGTLVAESRPLTTSTSVIAAAFLKVAGPVLQRVTAPDGERYSPRPPVAAQMLDVSLQAGSIGKVETLRLTAGLGELFRGAVNGESSVPFLHLVAPDNTGMLVSLPRRWVQPPSRATRSARAPGAATLARVGTSTAALSALARPNTLTVVSAHSLLADTTVQPTRIDASRIHSWALDNLVIAPATAGQPPERSLPVADDPDAPLWRDRLDANLRWYAPLWQVQMPEANADPGSSPFLFEFRAVGHTASGAPGLEGHIRFRLQARMSDATRAAWEAAGKPTARAVDCTGLSVGLSIPFRDQAGATRAQIFRATVTLSGDTATAEVALLDDWVRLAYGALSTPGFQTQQAAISVAYVFSSYVTLTQTNLALLFDRKQALTQVVKAPTGVAKKNGAYLDAKALAYRTPLGSIQFAQEKATESRATALARPQAALFTIRPELAHSSDLAELLARRPVGLQTLGRDSSQPVVYACSTLGAFYIQDNDDGSRAAIGCRDAFRLGQTEYRQYERVSDLDDPDFSVWRSLQQPGRFLMVPARWSIARFSADDPDRAYRPAILVYSTVDPDAPANNRCVVLASLIPDVSPAKQQALLRSLAALAQQPVLTLVNEIDAELEYVWPLPASSGMDVRVAKLFDSFQISIGTGIDAMPQLQAMLRTSGLLGTVHYRLPDGSALECALSLDLNRIIGPLPDGPVQVTLQRPNATLTNRIERAVDVSDVAIEAGDTSGGQAPRIETVRVDQRVEPGAAIQIPVPADTLRATPVSTMAPGDAATLTEIRSFVEDVHTNVAFVNLINYANHGLSALSLQARLRGVDGTQTLTLDPDAPVSTLDFVLPLTTYLASPILEFAVTRTVTDGTSTATGWLEWPLTERGNVVSLTWDLIQQETDHG